MWEQWGQEAGTMNAPHKPKKARKTSSARRKGGNAWLAIEKWRKSLPKKGQELPPIEQMLADIGFVPHAH